MTLVGGLSMIIIGIMEGPDRGWSSAPILTLLAAGVVLLAAFIRIERRVAAPLIDTSLFADRITVDGDAASADSTFTASNLVIFTAQYSKMAMFVFCAMFLQDTLGMSPLMAGIALLPTVAPQILMAPLAGKAADRFGDRNPTLLGLLALAVGLGIIIAGIYVHTYAILFWGLLAWGLSQAFLFVPPQRAVMSSVPPQKHGQAGGIAMSMQLIGATVGMAVCSTIFSMTHDYQIVFLANVLFAAFVFLVAVLGIRRPRAALSAAR